jgi:hypothetical protein
MLVHVSHRYAALVVLLLRGAAAHAGSVQGTLLVSVTVVGSCEVAVTDPGLANITCPEAFPYRVSFAGVTGAQVAPGQAGQLLVGRQQLVPAELASALLSAQHSALRSVSTATGLASGTVTMLTISY